MSPRNRRPKRQFTYSLGVQTLYDAQLTRQNLLVFHTEQRLKKGGGQIIHNTTRSTM
jgi:hypothetical protein